jgi:Outer membrane protein beta-barrel domain
MAEFRLVQKEEIAVVPMRCMRVAHTSEPEIRLLPDCSALSLRATVADMKRQRRLIMTRWIASLVAVIGLVGASQAYAQEAAPGPGVVEVSIIPGGGMFFTEDKDSKEPSFGNYDLGGAVTFNLNRYVGVEGEVSGALGVSQELDFGGIVDRKTPHFLNYSGNVVVSAPNRSSVVPYVTGGIGGLSLFEKASLGINQTETFLTGNVGGGVKWYAGRWGLRGDYRFIGVQSKDDAPAFFGQETRYGHRVYGAVILNVVR